MKSFKHYILIIAISLLPFVSMLITPMAPHTHDSPVHFARMAAYYKALAEGQLLPRWAGELNYGYGMPLFNFIYHVPYLVTSLFIFLGGGLVFSFKMSMLISFLLSGIGMYAFAHRLLRHEGKAFVATILYQFAPFHLVDLVVRGDVAEGYALAFLPWILYTVVYGFENDDTKKNIVFTSLATLLLITSHNAISLVFFGVVCLFVLVFAPDMRKRIEAGVGLGLGLALSAFYWLPALIERKFTYGDLFMKNMYESHFAPFFHFLVPNITNSESMQTGGIAVSFGLIQVAALTIGVVMLIRNTIRDAKEKKTVLFALILTLGAFFFMQPVSKVFWAGIPILRMFQFPWRFLNIAVFSLAILGGTVLIRKKTTILLSLIIVLMTVLSVSVYFRPPLGTDRIDEAYYWNYPLNTTYFGETDVIWSAGPAGAYPDSRFDVIGGEGSIVDPVKKGTLHTFTVRAETDVHVVDRTQYFPGWRVYVDGQKTPIEFQDQNWRGLITFRVPSGTHHIRVSWEESPVRRIAEATTALAFFTVAVLLVLPRRGKRRI